MRLFRKEIPRFMFYFLPAFLLNSMILLVLQIFGFLDGKSPLSFRNINFPVLMMNIIVSVPVFYGLYRHFYSRFAVSNYNRERNFFLTCKTYETNNSKIIGF